MSSVLTQFFRHFLRRCLSGQESGFVGKRKAIAIQKQFSLLEHAFLSTLSTQGFHATVVMDSFILSLVYIQFEILLHSLQALGAEMQWSVWLVNPAEPCRHISPYFSEDEPSRHICSSLGSWLESVGVTDTTGVHTLL